MGLLFKFQGDRELLYCCSYTFSGGLVSFASHTARPLRASASGIQPQPRKAYGHINGHVKNAKYTTEACPVLSNRRFWYPTTLLPTPVLSYTRVIRTSNSCRLTDIFPTRSIPATSAATCFAEGSCVRRPRGKMALCSSSTESCPS